MENKFALVSAEEEQRIGRALLVWLNYYPDKPVGRINFEFLPIGSAGVMMSSIQAAIKTRQYITGGYEAQYQFSLVYRAYPDDNDSRLAADEMLNSIGVWAERSTASLVLDGAIVRSVKRNSNASLLAAYDDGSRDHQILMTLTYEVI